MTNVLSGILIFLGSIALVCLILGLPLLLLWNWLIPTLFAGPELTFWQAVGLNLLSSILFKSSSTSNTKSE